MRKALFLFWMLVGAWYLTTLLVVLLLLAR